MVIHIFPDEKFTYDYIQRINRLYDKNKHIFLIYYSGQNLCTRDMVKNYNNVFFISTFKDSIFLDYYEKAEKIICHSLFFRTRDLIALYNVYKRQNRKMIWALWGGDLYDEYRRNHKSLNIKARIREYYRKKIIASFYKVLSTSDYEQMKKWYETNAVQGKGLYSYEFKPIEKIDKKEFLRNNVMIGHSATATCCHKDAFELLSKYKDSIEVYCPLSYPKNEEYIKQVDEAGVSIYAESYHPLKDFMNYHEYVGFLNNMDVGIFNNDRQQGMGNIVNLLYLGKKVYMNKKNTLYQALCEEGFTLFDIENIKDNTFFKDLTNEQKEKNRKLIEYRYSDENFLNIWNKVFND